LNTSRLFGRVWNGCGTAFCVESSLLGHETEGCKTEIAALNFFSRERCEKQLYPVLVTCGSLGGC